MVEHDLAGLLRRMLDGGTLPRSVRVVGLGGEVIPEALINDIRKLGTVHKALNYYGPTGTTICSTVAWLIGPDAPNRASDHDSFAGHVFGRPIANTRVYIVDADGRIAPNGEIGEICIASAGVARGYLDAPDLTAERFGRDPFNPDPQARWYRTGDRGRLLPDGSTTVAILAQRVEYWVEYAPRWPPGAVLMHAGLSGVACIAGRTRVGPAGTRHVVRPSDHALYAGDGSMSCS